MRWRKAGLVYCPDGSQEWARHSALQPTPILIDPETIRVFVGFRDDVGTSRVGFVDVAAADPTRVLDVSSEPALDIGQPGTFDDNGVVPCAVVQREHGLFLYYAGYQIPEKIKFFVFSGLAVSNENGTRFTRRSRVPLLERTEDDLFFRVVHSIRFEDGRWRSWYGGGDSFIEDDGKILPVYDVRYMESDDGVRFPSQGKTVVTFSHPDEYRIGRPYVVVVDGKYRMFYGTARRRVGYRLGYAESTDGLNWVRRDEDIGIDVSPTGWDSGMVAYPAVINAGGATYMFYNGGDMGRSGFGCAVLESW